MLSSPRLSRENGIFSLFSSMLSYEKIYRDDKVIPRKMLLTFRKRSNNIISMI